MNARFMVILAMGCARPVPPAAAMQDAPAETLVDLDPAALMGTWFVVGTTLDFWQDRTDPRLVYAPLSPDPKTGAARWSDTVVFLKNGRERTIEGIDTLDLTRTGHFQWQGSGLLASLRSQCFIVAMDPEGAWAVSYFSATAATPAGMDLLSRSLDLADDDRVQAHVEISKMPSLSVLWESAYPPVHTLKSAQGAIQAAPSGP